MTQEQYDRWKDFALRMARTCFNRRRNPGPKDILARVQQFFEWVEDGCHAGDFADYLPTIESWDHCTDWSQETKDSHQAKWKFPLQDPQPVCDFVADMAEYWIPGYWSIPDAKYEAVRERWLDAPSACIRAGLDMACEPSAGVVGFTVGDLRRMYPEGVPSWLTEQFINDKTGKPVRFNRLADKTPLWL